MHAHACMHAQSACAERALRQKSLRLGTQSQCSVLKIALGRNYCPEILKCSNETFKTKSYINIVPQIQHIHSPQTLHTHTHAHLMEEEED